MEIPEKSGMHLRRVLVVLLFLSLLIIPAVSVTITARPETIANGYPITITVTDLPDGAQFSLLVEAKYSVSPNTEFQFQMSQFKMPFSLKTSSITATLEGTSQNRLEVKKRTLLLPFPESPRMASIRPRRSTISRPGHMTTSASPGPLSRQHGRLPPSSR